MILPEEELQNIFRANTDEKFYEYRYDEAGNVIARISYDMEKHFVLTENYVYDDAGRLIQRKIFGDGRIYGSAVYLYDDTGTLSEIQFTDEYHGMGEQYLYFDEAGNVIRYVGNKNGREMLFDYDEKGTPRQKTVNLSWNSDKASLIYTYVNGCPVLQSCRIRESILYFDETGKKIREETCGTDGAMLTSTVFTYNGTGLLEEKLESDAEGALRARTRYEYDEERELACFSETVYGTDGTILSEKHSSMEENTKSEGMQLDENGVLTAWNGTDALGNRVEMEFAAIDPDDPAYRLYTYCEYAELIPSRGGEKTE